MNAHTLGGCSAIDGELLNAYLDEELEAGESARLEDHLRTCTECRAQLDSLARVAGTLRSLERVAPPPILEEMVLGRLEVRGARTWSRRLDAFLSADRRTRSSVGFLFALVMMLVMLVFLFSEAQGRRQQAPRVISLPASAFVSSSHVERVVEGRRFLLAWADEPSTSGPLAILARGVGVDGFWVEVGGEAGDFGLGGEALPPATELPAAASCSSETEVDDALLSPLTGDADPRIGLLARRADGSLICRLPD